MPTLDMWRTGNESAMDAPKALTIGRLAMAADVNVETIRYYQRIGLIKEPPKPAQGYRQYPVDDITRVHFIRRAQQLGFTLKEIRDLLDLGDGHCQEVQQLAKLKIKNIEKRLQDLQSMRGALMNILSQCEATGTKDVHCALVETLSKEVPIDIPGEIE